MSSWWRHQMETFSVFLALCAGNSPVTGEFPAQRPVTRSFDVFFDLRLNNRLSKQSWGWWFETPSVKTDIYWCVHWSRTRSILLKNEREWDTAFIFCQCTCNVWTITCAKDKFILIQFHRHWSVLWWRNSVTIHWQTSFCVNLVGIRFYWLIGPSKMRLWSY